MRKSFLTGLTRLTGFTRDDFSDIYVDLVSELDPFYYYLLSVQSLLQNTLLLIL
jgi:hypothetical protein